MKRGFSEVIDLSAEGLAEGVRRITDGYGADIIVDSVGGDILSDALGVFRHPPGAFVVSLFLLSADDPSPQHRPGPEVIVHRP